MAYDKQTFTVGQVLTAAEQNQIEENIEEVRRCHKGSSAPPQLVAGVLWIDDTTSPWLLQFYDGTGWTTLGVVDPTGDSFTPSRIGTYVNASDGGPYISSTTFDVDASVTEDTWESVGPTGSGASNIWTGLDSVPLGVDWIEIKALSIVSNNAGSSTVINIWIRATGSAIGKTLANRVVDALTESPTSGAFHSIDAINNFKAPVDSSNRFDVRWADTGNSRFLYFYLTGYGYNEP